MQAVLIVIGIVIVMATTTILVEKKIEKGHGAGVVNRLSFDLKSDYKLLTELLMLTDC